MTQNMDRNSNDPEKKTDSFTWTAYGDPLKNDPSSPNDEQKNAASPILEKAKEDGNIVKKE